VSSAPLDRVVDVLIARGIPGVTTDEFRAFVDRNRPALEELVANAPIGGIAKRLALVVAETRDINDYVVQRHYLHRGRTMAQLGYFGLLDAPKDIEGDVVEAKPPAPWRLAGWPISGAVHYALPRVSVPIAGYHPMEILELARLYVEPGSNGKNPPHLAGAMAGRTVRRVADDWIERYEHLPKPRAILAYADTMYHEGTIYKALGFVPAGVTGGGRRSTSRTGAPEHEDLQHEKSRWILPLEPTQPLTGYAIHALVTGVTSRETFRACCEAAEIVLATFGLDIPQIRERCAYDTTFDTADLWLPIADEYGLVTLDHPGNFIDNLADTLREALHHFVAFEGDADVEMSLQRYASASFERGKGGRWELRRASSQEAEPPPARHDVDEGEDHYGAPVTLTADEAAALLATDEFTPSVGLGAGEHWRGPDGLHLRHDPVEGWSIHQDQHDPRGGLGALAAHIWRDVLGR